MVTATTIKKGYKQTELGVIPEDWDVKELGELVEVKDGTHQTPTYFDSGIPFYSVENVTNNDFTNTKYISEAEHKLLTKKFKIEEMDILMTRIGSIGDCKLITWNPNASFYVSLSLLKPKNKLNSPYIYHFSKTSIFKKELEDRSLQWAVPKKINLGEISKVKICIPKELPEQSAIATIFSDTDALIERLEKLIAKKKNIKQGAMQQLLTGKKRLPEFGGEWGMKKLGEMGKCYRGVSYNPSTDLSAFDTDSTFRLLRSNNVQESKVVFSDMQFVDTRRVSDIQRLYKNDILICMANGSKVLVGKAGRFSADDGYTYTFGAFMGCFRSNEQAVNPDYVFYLFQTEKYRSHVLLLLAGSSINNLRPSDLEDLSISVPLQQDEQTAIATILSDMDAEIEALEQKRDKYTMIKQGMMQQLLTGRIRVHDID